MKELGKVVGCLFIWALVLVMASSITTSSAVFFDRPHKSLTPTEATSSSSSSSSLTGARSSIVLPVHGNVYPIGSYNVTLNVGQPPKPYFLDPDSGSDLTWLQCDAPCVNCTEAPHPPYQPSNDLVGCRDPLCIALQSPKAKPCKNLEQCDYIVEYADGGSSLGVLVRDAFTFNFINGAKLNPRLALGCGYNQNPGASFHPIDGVLGLGKGKTSLVSQLHSQGLVQNVVGHCFGGRGGGFLFFGDDLYDSSRIIWTPMFRDHSKHYSLGNAELLFGGKSTGFKNLVTIFDSGSSYTYLNSQAYQALTFWIKRDLTEKPLEEAEDDQTLPLCWKGKRPFKSIRDVRKYFKSLALIFVDGSKKNKLELPPEAYLIISSKGNVCLGILNGTEVGLEKFNIIGDISMLDKMVIYDNEKGAIGWVSANCDQLPRSSYRSLW